MASVALLLLLMLLVAACGGCEFNCSSNNVGRVGQRSVLDCVIQSTKKQGLMVVLWKKDGKTLVVYDLTGESPILEVENGYVFTEPRWSREKINVSLIIENTAEAHGGQYNVQVLGDCKGEESVSFHVPVNEPQDPEKLKAPKTPVLAVIVVLVVPAALLVWKRKRAASHQKPVGTKEGSELSVLDPGQLA